MYKCICRPTLNKLIFIFYFLEFYETYASRISAKCSKSKFV